MCVCVCMGVRVRVCVCTCVCVQQRTARAQHMQAAVGGLLHCCCCASSSSHLTARAQHVERLSPLHDPHTQTAQLLAPPIPEELPWPHPPQQALPTPVQLPPPKYKDPPLPRTPAPGRCARHPQRPRTTGAEGWWEPSLQHWALGGFGLKHNPTILIVDKARAGIFAGIRIPALTKSTMFGWQWEEWMFISRSTCVSV